MKKYVFLIICAALYSAGYAQNTGYLVSINLTYVQNLDELESLKLKIFHETESTLITIVDQTKMEMLDQLKINFNIIDENPHHNKYFLIDKSKAYSKLQLSSNSILFDSDNVSIVKDLYNEGALLENGFRIAEAKLTPRIFKKLNYVKTVHNDKLDSIITNVTYDINIDSVGLFVKSLEAFGTRFLFAENRFEIAEWLQNQFLKFGIEEVEIDSFEYSNTWQYNVIATIKAAEESDKYFIVGAHHDSYSRTNPIVYAPGADDNASGTAAVLEIARVMALNNFESNSNIRFITFGAEEYGLYGSKDYAYKAASRNENIKLMINHDMISYSPYNVQDARLAINYYSGSEDFRDLAIESAKRFSGLNKVSLGELNSGGSDSYSFWNSGFNAVYFEEEDFTPYYHSASDIFENTNMPFCTEVIKGSAATLISAIVIPPKVENMNIVDLGDGQRVRVSWDLLSNENIIEYKIGIGTTSGNYTRVLTSADNSIIIDELIDSRKYYFSVSAINTNSFESILVEKSFTPLSIPRAPLNIAAIPGKHKISVKWSPNLEADILGYNIYRRVGAQTEFTRFNSALVTDTVYTDESAEVGKYSFYKITAVDSLLNESLFSLEVKSLPFTFTDGMLVIDETSDGSGALGKPTDKEVDDYFDEVLKKFKHTNYDLVEMNGISVNDLGAYSTLIWHGNDINNMTAAKNFKEALSVYLAAGGNFIYAGYIPTKAFDLNNTYPIEYNEGDFIYDYLKIAKAEKFPGSRFIAALSNNSLYNTIRIDTTKVSSNTFYHLANIEALYASKEAANIYIFESEFDSSTIQGSMKGMPVGVQYNGRDYKSLVLSFPLYFMEKESVAEFFTTVLSSVFDEIVSVETEGENVLKTFSLKQNYPNPFNPISTIEFSLPQASDITLKVHDILGREITTLAEGIWNAGNHKVLFNSSLNRNLSSGVYFYTLSADGYSATRKLLLLK
ncbi:MAG: M20/M25/M40 family metallo-hydrolase [Bacteroidetes bacterium]|nr:M20/M25/M40 family metallo-hydrolase [Bacteroidota bacterium]